MSAAPLLDAAALRAAGRAPATPFRVQLADGRIVQIERLLRVLPGKRIVGAGTLEGEAALVKLFIAPGSARHWQREMDGLAALQGAALPTPAVLAAAPLAGEGHAVLTAFLADAEPLSARWQRSAADDADARLALLAPALALLRRAHAAGLVQSDLHLGNFLAGGGQLWMIDGDAVERPQAPGVPLSSAAATANLALLLAQFTPQWDEQAARCLHTYLAAGDGPAVALPQLLHEIERQRAARLADFLAKSGRECTLFQVRRSATRFSAVVRDEADALAPLLADPDAAIAHGRLLKDGRTCTVAQVEVAGRARVVKRYNLKHLGHALSRCWRHTRAWQSWREAHRLRFLGIATPAPLALLEARLGPLRGRAWLVTEHCPGVDLLTHLDPQRAPPPAEAAALRELFAALHRARINHGDLKATNLLWHGGQVVVIDLDAMRQHASAASHARAWARDRARLLRNWPQDSALWHWLDTHLPPAP